MQVEVPRGDTLYDWGEPLGTLREAVIDFTAPACLFSGPSG